MDYIVIDPRDIEALQTFFFELFAEPEKTEPKPDVKPAITGLTTEWAGDHRLGMFK